METYQKINGLYKRYREGPNKGRFIMGEWAVPEFGYLANNQWEFTEKVDGTNIRIGWNAYSGEVEFGGRSDTAVIPKPLLAYLEETFTPELFFNAGLLGEFVLFGEGYGPKIQGGGKYRDNVSFVLFDIVSKSGTIEEWITNHSDQQSATPNVATLQEVSVSHAIERDSDRSLSLEKSGTSGPESIETLTSNEPTILGRVENGTYRKSLASLSNSTRKCLSCKVEFVPSVIMQKLPEAGTGILPRLPLTTATIVYVLEAYCVEHVMSAFNKLTSIRAGSKQPQPTSHNFWLDRDNVNDVASKLGIDSVPVLGTGTLWQAIAFVTYGTPYTSVEIDRFKIMSENDPDLLDRLAKPMRSQWGDFEAEGIVARPTVPLFNRKGERIITKIKAVDFR